MTQIYLKRINRKEEKRGKRGLRIKVLPFFILITK